LFALAQFRQDTNDMQTPDENAQVAQVVDRLVAKYPTVPREQIQVVVARLQAKLQEAPVRDFVPVLIENEARDLISAKIQQADFSKYTAETGS
jgi:type II secretory pathway predicted ATPase ExeA